MRALSQTTAQNAFDFVFQTFVSFQKVGLHPDNGKHVTLSCSSSSKMMRNAGGWACRNQRPATTSARFHHRFVVLIINNITHAIGHRYMRNHGSDSCFVLKLSHLCADCCRMGASDNYLWKYVCPTPLGCGGVARGAPLLLGIYCTSALSKFMDAESLGPCVYFITDADTYWADFEGEYLNCAMNVMTSLMVLSWFFHVFCCCRLAPDVILSKRWGFPSKCFLKWWLSQQPQAILGAVVGEVGHEEAGGTDPAQGRGIVQWLQWYAMRSVGFCCLGFAICSQDAWCSQRIGTG